MNIVFKLVFHNKSDHIDTHHDPDDGDGRAQGAGSDVHVVQAVVVQAERQAHLAHRPAASAGLALAVQNWLQDEILWNIYIFYFYYKE